MGCGGSKVDDLPLVTLCRERKQLIKSASDYRYALAAAHVAYFHSLRDVGDSIHRFVDEDILIASPVLTLPSREGKSKSSSSSTSLSHSLDYTAHGHEHSHSNHSKSKRIHKDEEIDHGHLNLSTSGSDSGSESDSGHIHDIHEDERYNRKEDRREEEEEDQQQQQPSGFYGPPSYPVQSDWGFGENPYPYPYPYPFPPPYYPDPGGSNTSTTAYFMKKAPTPAKTVVYEDPSVSGYAGSDYYGNGGYFGYGYPMPSPRREPSPPKPPPSPPRVSTWDFLNVFDSFESGVSGYPGYYPTGRFSTTSSPDSKEVREREGIPDLEDETEQEITIKEAYKGSNEEEVKKKYGEGTSKSAAFERDGESYESLKGKGVKTSSSSPDTFRSPTESLVSKSTSPDETNFVKKKGVSFEVEDGSGTVSSSAMDVETSSKPTTSTTTTTTTTSSLTTLSGNGTRDLQEVVKEIRDEFEVATGYGKEVALMLEVGKLPYQRRRTSLKVILSRILYLVSLHPPASQPIQVSSRVMKMAKAYSAEPGNHFDMQPKNLSSTLDKLYEWEKKLYKEVKDEERLRVIYEKKCKRLRTLDDRGAESSKIDAEQASIRKILTKINVCIRAIESISSKIHKLRDEELQPQIAELIQRFTRMWKSMLRCHQKQFHAIMESKVRSLKANTGLQTDSGLKATVELEMELINWTTRLSDWINTQKSYVESLNEWLSKCLLQEPEETADGFAPFSPSRAGAPPIFVICNDWCQAMGSISEKGVENAMLDFATRLHELWERQGAEQRQRIKAEYLTRDFEKQLRTLRMERGRIEQEQDALSDKTISKVNSESGVSPLDDLKVDLDSMKKKLQEERAKQKEAAKLVHAAASSSIQAGLVPIFEALGNFSAEVLKVHEQVRLEYAGGS